MTFGKQRDPLERELARNRPEPRPDYVERLVTRIGATHPAPARPLRLALAAALTLSLLVVFAAFGGVGYATSAASEAIHTVKVSPTHTHPALATHSRKHAAKALGIQHAQPSSPSAKDSGKPDDDQYRPGCGKGDRNHDHTGPRGHHHGFPGTCPHGG
jgi:hypothetical protein